MPPQDSALAKTSNESNSSMKLIDPTVEDLPFSFEDLKKAIPAHCFKHSHVRSFLWLAHDVVLYSLLMYLGKTFLLNGPWYLDNVVGWLIFALVVGTQLTGLWVIAHECGHGAFAKPTFVNDLIGWVLHSYVLVPYFAWQYTHAVHHKRTNHLLEGETHVPNQKKEIAGLVFEFRAFLWKHCPRWVNDFFGTLLFCVLGWPLYVMFHVSGSPAKELDGASHFTVEPLFPKRLHWKIIASNVGLLLTLIGVIGTSWYIGSIMPIVKMWLGPLIVVNSWLACLTFVHHSTVRLPHYRGPQWNWLKGAISTVDAEYGWIIDWLHHDIGRTHAAHHLFSYMPFYHTREATEALKKFLAKHNCLHLYTTEPRPYRAIVKNQYDLWYVSDEGDVVYYKSIDDYIKETQGTKAN